jgi:[ribosomal protein S5]-alanine N-acetyltransferase
MTPEESSPVEIETPRLRLTLPPTSFATLLVRYYLENRDHLERWSPPRPPGFYGEEFWRWRLEQNRADYQEDRALRLCLLARESPAGPVIGQVSFSEILRGPLQSCFLGYAIDHRYQGKGLMKEALGAAIDFAFQELALHRIHANHMPENERSAVLLDKLGFAIEGYARQYLFVGGAWRDHVLTAKINPSGAGPGMRVAGRRE